MELRKMEEKWQKKWAEERVYEPGDRGGEKKFYTAAFPYPNSPQHIGHGRTYTLLDIHARYARLSGKNVLLPMGFHVTGTPIIAMAKKVREKDAELLSIFRDIYGIDESMFGELEDPSKLVMYFSGEIEEGMREMGYSIDWRRKFYTSDGHFNKFIQWQMRKLHGLGLITKGSHFLPWCPSDGNVVSSHDTKGDVDPELKEFTAIKFAFEDGFMLTATLRPETIYGVTNIWVNPDVVYVKAKSRNGEIYYVSGAAYEKMNYQGYGLEVIEEIRGEQFIGKKAKNIITDEEVPVYEGKYVKEDEGTGIVMSVPSHAPYDHIALLDLGIKLDYEQIIDVEGYKFMAKELIEKRGITDQHDPRLEDIVKEVYKKEILTGTMVAGPYKGEKVSVAIEKTKEDMNKNNQGLPLWEISNKPVYCRCGAHAVVNKVEDQWFIDYGNAQWKEKAKKCLAQMALIPESTRKDYLATIDWLKEKACTRASGLGTPFPFDGGKIVEPLSDSTIYMAFYTISHELAGMEPSELTDGLFDYVFLGEGEESVHPRARELREKFEYWYPLDARHSGADLVRNHLPFFIFNHAAIFQEGKWPREIIVNGFVLMEGKKMSKSLGNILPLRKAIREYSADVIRFSTVAGADLSADTNFETSVAFGVKERIEYILSLLGHSGKKGNSRADRWLLSRLNRKLKELPLLYSSMAIRELGQMLFYEMCRELQWYTKRVQEPALGGFFGPWAVAFSPFMPHVCEEIWNLLGEKGLVVSQRFPEADESMIDDSIEMGEEVVSGVLDDVEKISGRLDKKPSKVYLYVASQWKRGIYQKMRDKKDLQGGIEWAKGNAVGDMGAASAFAKSLMKKVHSLPPVLDEGQEHEALSDASGFLEKELGAEVVVRGESEGGHEKARNAVPGKPAIVLE